MNLKSILKTLKLNENSISTFLGILVVVLIAVSIFRYVKTFTNSTNKVSSLNTEVEYKTKHKVKKGESLWSIAQMHYKSGFEWQKISDANKINKPYSIEVGQELLVPDPEIPISENIDVKNDQKIVSPIPSSIIETQSNAIAGASYEVKKGESLWSIAIRAYQDGYRWTQIAKENNLSNPNQIYAGNILVLPR